VTQPPSPPGQPAVAWAQPARVANLASHLAGWLRTLPEDTTVAQIDCADLATVALSVDAAYLATLATDDEPTEPTEAQRHDQVVAAAQLLAERSGNPRFGPDGYGWQGLLAGEHNVENAYRMAVRATGASTEALRRARELLLGHARLERCTWCQLDAGITT
jgi:hypothetical protein